MDSSKNLYTLKDGTTVESIEIGKAKIKIGDISPDGMLTICDRAPNREGSRKARVICKCHCGNYTIMNAQDFYSGKIKSCGCYAKEIQKELGHKVGKLPKDKDYTKVNNPYYTFIQKMDERDKSNSFYWEIECKKCHRRYKAVPVQLVSDTRRRGTNPCSCWRNQSKGVLKITNILEENHIKYIKEYSFKDCLSPLGNTLYFDFFLPDYNTLVEYDGEQHFKPTTFGGVIDGAERLALNQEYDEIKNLYCSNHQIKLIRIPYTQYKDITLEMILGVQKNEQII